MDKAQAEIGKPKPVSNHHKGEQRGEQRRKKKRKERKKSCKIKERKKKNLNRRVRNNF
jgi:hypothetical protein